MGTIEDWKQDALYERQGIENERRQAEEWPECDHCGHHVDPDKAVTCELCSAVLCEWDAVPLDLEDGTWRCRGRHYFDDEGREPPTD